MQRLDLKQMMSEAKQDTKAIEKLRGDWRTQIQMLNRTVAVMTTYQKAIHKAFGTPNGHRRSGYFSLPEGVVALEQFQEIEDLSFNGAALVQTLEVVHDIGTTVRYKAILKVDENYFLGQMLPQVQPLRNADPDYTIYDLAIEIPKGELVAESLQMLNERINGSEEVKKTRPSEDDHLDFALLLQQVFGTATFAVPLPPSTTSEPPTGPAFTMVWQPNGPRFLPSGAFQ